MIDILYESVWVGGNTMSDRRFRRMLCLKDDGRVFFHSVKVVSEFVVSA